MSRSALRRVVEAFFHRWPFYVLLLVVALVAGMFQIRRGTDLYVSAGSILTEGDTLVSAQSGVQNEPSYGYLTPAQYTAQELIGLLLTDVFMESVATNAGIELPDDPSSRTFSLQVLRSSFDGWPTSDTIVYLSVTTDDPQRSADLATAALEEYLAFRRTTDAEESVASEAFFDELAASYRLELDQAREELDAALAQIDTEDGPTALQEAEIEALAQVEEEAAARYNGALQNREEARLAERQIDTDLAQRYAILDQPEVSSAPIGRRLDDVLALAMFGLVGLLLMIAGPVFAALSNEILVFPDDLDPDLNIGIVASLPRYRRRQLDPSRAIDGPTDGPVEPVPEQPSEVLVAAAPGAGPGATDTGP